MLLDFGLMSLLLVVSHLLRSRSRLLQHIYLPTPIIAGLLGLLGSRQFLGVIPFSVDSPESGELAMSSYPGQLVVILFGTLFLGARPKRPSLRTVVRNSGDTFFYNLASELGQFGVAMLFGALVLAVLFPDLNRGFAVLMPAGFVGGHGTAAVIGGSLQTAGWDDALSIANTFATVGLVAGILGGMILINVGTRLGWTRLVKSAHELPDSMRKGFLNAGERTSLGEATVSPIALDPLTWHVALVLLTFLAAHVVNDATKEPLTRLVRSVDAGAGVPPASSQDVTDAAGTAAPQQPGAAGAAAPQRDERPHFELPLFALSMLAGACLQKLLDAFRLGQYVDRRVVGRIGSSVSDYLIAFGVASIKMTVVVKYAEPLAMMIVLGVAYSAAVFWLVGRRIFHNFWFERSIFVYGWNTGIVGIGITLLRIVDPNLRSKTLEDYGLAYVFISMINIVLLVTIPILVAQGLISIPAIVLLAAAGVCIVLSALSIGWFTAAPSEIREGERAVIEENIESRTRNIEG